MIPFPKIKKYYFTACLVLLLLLVVLMLVKNNWTPTPKAVISTLVGWMVLCAVIVGVIYLMVARRGPKNKTGVDGSQKEGGDSLTR